ncbi:hypothetical protein DH2020_000481 [Rehmannia glutinosa]|uniref:Gag-pol polyprotein n=1 Tax=Rehmannia glutinosa TaxID=99300 RepID=A0ABR0XWM4_REHGL
MEGCKTVATPLDNNKALKKEDSSPKADNSQYQSLIGSLLYLTATRPDIMEGRFKLIGYSDSDYAGCRVDKKSTSGTCQMLGNRLVSWFSKKQNSIATSTAEAEYIIAGSCCAQFLWMRQQLRDYDVEEK